jgi:bifunctional non-homologous end joining protein LigD
MALEQYRAKRNFTHTPEPKGVVKRHAGKPVFVIQEHHASKLHYDLRLESGGVLKSWAVPREPTMDPTVKRLAVRVEDHPLAYARFQGDIPQGEYGAGHVEIWDQGTYQVAKPAKALERGLDDGKVEFELHGQRLKGKFTLLRTQWGRGKDNWLLIKLTDAYAQPGTAAHAAISGRRNTTARTHRRPNPKSNGKATGRPRTVEFTHTDKVLFPAKGYTKGDVLEFYEKIADRLLPHLKDRPVTLERLPDGLQRPNSPHFWQKNTPDYYPDWIPRIDLPTERGKPVQYALVNDLQTLLYLVNQGTMTFHVYFSRVSDLEHPDYVLFDLDPGQATFQDAVKVAKHIHRLLVHQGADSFPKTSGKSGLHIVVPWKQSGGYDDARSWAMDIARRVEHDLPDVATVQRSKAKRHGRVYVDVMQNVLGHHVVPPYVLRATPEATVSTPLDWKEVTAKLNPKAFDIKTIFARLKKGKGWDVIH